MLVWVLYAHFYDGHVVFFNIVPVVPIVIDSFINFVRYAFLVMKSVKNVHFRIKYGNIYIKTQLIQLMNKSKFYKSIILISLYIF